MSGGGGSPAAAAGAAPWPVIGPQAGRIAVYSCWFGRYEPFNPAATGPGGGYDRIVFTDDPGLAAEGVRAVVIDGGSTPPAILSRLPKLRPHLFLSRYDWVIYVDNNATLIKPPKQIVRYIEKTHPEGAPPGRYLIRHKRRDCAHREVEECARLGHLGRADADRIRNLFQKEGFATRAGLYVNTCMIQRMGSPETDALNDAWYDSLSVYTRRDQVMLPYLLWKTGCPHGIFAGGTKKIIDWPVFGPQARLNYREGRGRFGDADRESAAGAAAEAQA